MEECIVKKVLIVGTLDTKAKEFQFVKDTIESKGVKTVLMDAGVFDAHVKADITNHEVAKAAGYELDDLRSSEDRGKNVKIMSKGAQIKAQALLENDELSGFISLGGSGGSSIAAKVMEILPVGMPKVLVSTMAAGDVSSYVGVKDVMMMYSVVDVAGLNDILKTVLTNASIAIVGMVKEEKNLEPSKKPLIAATMFGVTTPAVEAAKAHLEKQGYDVVVFHATGAGGRSMEALIESGYFKGVLDLTTTEWCDELVGGVLSAGPKRLDAASQHDVPQVVSVGALDMVNFGPVDTVPSQFEGRNFYEHNASVTLMRTNEAENKELGTIIANKLNQASANAALFLPLKGVSMLDNTDMPFKSSHENTALFNALKANLDQSRCALIEKDEHINDQSFAVAMADKLIEIMNRKEQ